MWSIRARRRLPKDNVNRYQAIEYAEDLGLVSDDLTEDLRPHKEVAADLHQQADGGSSNPVQKEQTMSNYTNPYGKVAAQIEAAFGPVELLSEEDAKARYMSLEIVKLLAAAAEAERGDQ